MVIPVIYIVCMVRQVLGKNHLYKTVVIDKLNSKKYQYMPCQINWTCCSTKIIATKGNNKIEITKHKTSICYMENPLKLRGKNYSTISEKFTIINWENTKMYQFEYTLKLCHHYNLEVEPQTTNPVVLSLSWPSWLFSLLLSLLSRMKFWFLTLYLKELAALMGDMYSLRKSQKVFSLLHALGPTCAIHIHVSTESPTC